MIDGFLHGHREGCKGKGRVAGDTERDSGFRQGQRVPYHTIQYSSRLFSDLAPRVESLENRELRSSIESCEGLVKAFSNHLAGA